VAILKQTRSMRKLLILLFTFGCALSSKAQTGSALHHGTFKKNKIFMSSKPYKPDDWEKQYYNSSVKTAFPSDLNKSPEMYTNKLIHLIGVVDSFYIDNNDSMTNVTFLLDNKYWDYIEDYSIQDEVMFVSEKGDGKFLVKLSDVTAQQIEDIKRFPLEKKLFLVYGIFKGLSNNYPILVEPQIKYIDYEQYTMNVYSYEIERDNNGNVVTGKKGNFQTTNFKFFKVPKQGQNK
jgi:hypothetical protein